MTRPPFTSGDSVEYAPAASRKSKWGLMHTIEAVVVRCVGTMVLIAYEVDGEPKRRTVRPIALRPRAAAFATSGEDPP